MTTVTTKNGEGVSLSGRHSRHGCHGQSLGGVQGAFQRAALLGEATAVAGGKALSPSGEPTALSHQRGESVIVGYYTSAEVSPSTMPRTTSIYNQEERAYGKRRRH